MVVRCLSKRLQRWSRNILIVERGLLVSLGIDVLIVRRMSARMLVKCSQGVASVESSFIISMPS
jgi:hypothetical protein